MTGAPADGYAPVVVPKPLRFAWLLLLAGPVGLVALVVLYPRLRTRYVVRLPLSQPAFDRYVGLQRRRLWCAVLGPAGIVSALALRSLGVVALAIGLAAAFALMAAVSAHVRLPWSIPSATADGRWVTLRGVSEQFARAVA